MALLFGDHKVDPATSSFQFPNTLLDDNDIIHSQNFNGFMLDSEKFKEAFFYGGVGAYDIQYINLSQKKYSLDSNWFEDNKSYTMGDLKLFFLHVKQELTKNLNNKSNRVYLNRQEYCLGMFILSYDSIVKSNASFKNILDDFSFCIGDEINKNFNEVGDHNEIIYKPIIKMSANRYTFLLAFLLAESIYESPYYWMLLDKSYKDTSFKNRGLISEKMSKEILQKRFEKGFIYQGVKISKNKAHTVTDIDLLAIEKNKAIIFQVKAKKLTSLSKQGSIDNIENDFAKAVEDAFKQGLICEECIMNSTDYEFDTSEGESINDKIDKIENVYTICIVLDHYPAIAHSAHVLLYNKYSQSTIAFSLMDLEVICDVLKTPAQFFDYIICRTEYCRHFYAEEELCYLGYYLKHGLKPLEGVAHTFIDSKYANIVDEKFYTKHAKKELTTLNNEIFKKTKKIDRNKLCRCGSGKKYKDCHLRLD